MERWLERLRQPPFALGAGVAAVVLTAALVAVARSLPHHVPAAVLLHPTPSASPSTSTSPSPTPSPPAPTPSAPGCGSAPGGGFPGANLAAAFPTALAWSPDGRLFWAERGGAIRVWEGGAAQTFATVSTVTTEPGGGYSERGLLGLAISGHHVFAFYSNTDYTTQTVVRWTDCGGRATDMRVLAADLPAGSDCCHKGGRLAIDPRDGALFVTLGEEHVPQAAQSPGDPRGKVLRMDPDGGARSVWTLGLRNPYGIAFAPDGTLALTNNGPSGDAGTPCGSCGDEFDLVGRGSGVDYQWPFCWGYGHPFGGSAGCHNLPGPQYSTEGGPYARGNPYFVAPTGVTWAASGQFSGHFLFCALSSGHMYEYLAQGSVSDTGISGCQLDVKQGPDGALYTSDEQGIHRH